MDFVADIRGDGDHGRRDGDAKGNRGSGQDLAPFLPPEGFVDESDKHWLLLREHAASARDVGLLNDDGVGGLHGLQRHRVAATGRADGLRIYRSSAILADHPVAFLIEAYRAADVAGVEYRGDLAVGLLIEPEADWRSILLGLIAVQIAVGDLRERDFDLPVCETNFCRGRQSADI